MESALEKHLEPRVAALEIGMSNLSTQMGKVIDSMDTLSSFLHRSQRPDWQVIISAAALICLILGAVGAAWVSPLMGMQRMQEKQIDDIRAKWETTHCNLRAS